MHQTPNDEEPPPAAPGSESAEPTWARDAQGQWWPTDEPAAATDGDQGNGLPDEAPLAVEEFEAEAAATIPREPSVFAPFIAIPGSPTILAVFLAFATLPLTIAAMMAIDNVSTSVPTDHPFVGLGAYEAMIASVGAVFAGALVGGTVGGRFVRRRPLMGAFVALAAAWPAAIVGLTILPSLVGHPISIGSVCLGFNGRCDPALVAGSNILSASARYLESVLPGGMIGYFFGLPLLALAAILLRTRRRARPELVVVAGVVTAVLAVTDRALVLFGLAAVVAAAILCWGTPLARVAIGAVAAVLGIAALNFWSVAASGWTGLVLVGGVGVWAAVLSRPGFPRTAEAVPAA